MRPGIFTYLLLLGLILSVSCSKDAAEANETENPSEIGNPETPETGTPGTDNPDTGITAKNDAIKRYNDYYLAAAASTSDVAWTGDEPSCNAGSVPQATRDKILLRLTYFRKSAGLHNEISENETKSAKAQEAALMMHANGSLNHEPPNTWKCYTDEGREAAGKSLLTTTRNAPSIDSYMRDHGDANYPVGHRRWLLWPRLQEIGIGNTSSNNAIWVLGNPGARPDDAPEFIAWPPEGYLPKHLAYPRWSFSIHQADFSGTTIRMQGQNGEAIGVDIEELTGIYGDNTIVWQPEINTNTVIEDTRYTVRLENVVVGGEAQSFEYEVVLFDVDQQ